MITWMKDVPYGAILSDDDHYVLEEKLFLQIADYTRSQPTSPSPGRIYRKNHGWPTNMADNWFLYICAVDSEPGYVLHIGKPVLLVTDGNPPNPGLRPDSASRSKWGVLSEDGTTYGVGTWKDGVYYPGSRDDARRECKSLQANGEPKAKVVRMNA